MIKAKLFYSISLSLTLVLFAACNKGGESGGKKQPTIAVIPKGVSHAFWQTVKSGADAAGKDLNVKIIWKGAASETDYAGQVSIVEDMITQRVDGIVLAPSHGEALVPKVAAAQQAGIPVTIFDSGISTENYLSYVSTDNRAGGALAAKRMGEILGGKGKVAVLGVKKGSVSTDEREEGFIAAMKKDFPNIKIIEPIFYGEASAAKSLAATEDVLTGNADLTGLFASNESSTVGAVQAIRQRNLVGKVLLVGFDYTSKLGQDVKDGAIDSLVLQNPFKMGYEGVKTIVDKLAGKTPERRIDTGVELLTKENIDSPKMQPLLTK
jgi:ribose transport system substrate-binding protein